MWQLWIKPKQHTDLKGGGNSPEASEPRWTLVGDFPSISLAARRIIELEGYTEAGLPLSVFFHTEFMDDEDAVSHYRFNSLTKRYAIRRRDPPPPRFVGSRGEKPSTD